MEFAKWCGKNYIKLQKGWVIVDYISSNYLTVGKSTLYTTQELLEIFKEKTIDEFQE